MLPGLGEAEELDTTLLYYGSSLRPVSNQPKSWGCKPVPALLTEHVLGRSPSAGAQAARMSLFLRFLLLGGEVSIASKGTWLLGSGMCPLEIGVLQQEHLCVDPEGQKPAVGPGQLGVQLQREMDPCGTLWGSVFRHRSRVQVQPLLCACAMVQRCLGLAPLCSCPGRAGSTRWLDLDMAGGHWLWLMDGLGLLNCHRYHFPFHHKTYGSLGFSLSTFLWFICCLKL